MAGYDWDVFDKQELRVRVALKLLATFVAEDGWAQYKSQYPDDARTFLLAHMDCPRPPDFHFLLGKITNAFGDPLPGPGFPNPCPKPMANLQAIQQIFAIEEQAADKFYSALPAGACPAC